MDVSRDTIPELQPIFTFLNSHQNKLYQEGYFLKLDDQDSRGRPNSDRTWTECFAQLVGTILSLWDAAELDASGDDGEVLPKFINLTDASVKMIESLPTNADDEQPLQNILSISTAGRNRYLLHFNSHQSLLQWTAGIRLAIFEHSTLQESYTGALIAGKGKALNNITLIMDRTKVKVESWVRVRFGAGVPWRRCWCVITPPDEKEFQKLQKGMRKRSPYDRSHPPLLKGDIKFYDSRKEAERKKKARPIASIADAYAAYAIYPQARALIDGSTLVKIEGNITVHSDPQSSTEGFVFIMPEAPPAVSGFEMLLRFLFPTWDTFGLYGRPGKLAASVLDVRSLMFAMPKHRRYGYLEIQDVMGLIQTEGNAEWSEKDWRKHLKELTSERMATVEDAAKIPSRSASRSSKRLSFGPQPPPAARPRVNFTEDNSSISSSPSASSAQRALLASSVHSDYSRESPPHRVQGNARNLQSISDEPQPANLSLDRDTGNTQGASLPLRGADRSRGFVTGLASTPERVSSEDEHFIENNTPPDHMYALQGMQTPEPVNAPPEFSRRTGLAPTQKPYHSPDLRRATSRLSEGTLTQLAKAGGFAPEHRPAHPIGRHLRQESMVLGSAHTDLSGPSVQLHANADSVGTSANRESFHEALRFSNSTETPLPDEDQEQAVSSLPRQPPNPVQHDLSPFSYDPSMPAPPLNPRSSNQGPYSTMPQDPSHVSPKNFPEGYHGPSRASPQTPLRDEIRQHDQASSQSYRPLPPPSRGRSPPPEATDYSPPKPSERRSVAGSLYDDIFGTTGYFGAQQPTEMRNPERPRAGILKTVGDETLTAGSAAQAESSGYEIPDIDFGPTPGIGYREPPGRRATSASPPPPPEPRASSPDSERAPLNSATGHFSRNREPSDGAAYRTVAWQPGCARVGSPTGERAISPEQFVRQRAAAATTPNPPYSRGHQRQASSPHILSGLRTETPTPPLPGRQGNQDTIFAPTSSKRPDVMAHSRSISADLLQRPASRGAVVALSASELSSHLSAREQEHMARLTGRPLVDIASNRGAPQLQAGLLSAIEVRERERVQKKQELSGHGVAQAMDQRQRELQMQAQRAAQVAYAQRQAQLAAQSQQLRQVSGAAAAAPGSGLVASALGDVGSGTNTGNMTAPAMTFPRASPGALPRGRQAYPLAQSQMPERDDLNGGVPRWGPPDTPAYDSVVGGLPVSQQQQGQRGMPGPDMALSNGQTQGLPYQHQPRGHFASASMGAGSSPQQATHWRTRSQGQLL